MKVDKILNEVLDFKAIEGQFKNITRHLLSNQKNASNLQTDLEHFLSNLKVAADQDAESDKNKDSRIAELEKKIEAFSKEFSKINAPKPEVPSAEAQEKPSNGIGTTHHF